jgi:replicative DNA helicase
MNQKSKNQSSVPKNYLKKPESNINENIGLIPPQNIDIEKAVLGAILLEKNAINEVSQILTPDVFYKDAHRSIYESIIELYSTSEPIDILTVTNLLRKNGKLEQAGGAFYVAELTENVSSSANLDTHSKILMENYIKRESISTASMLQKMAYDPITDPFELIEFFSEFNLKILNQIDNGKTEDFRGILLNRIKKIGNLIGKEGKLTGIDTGYQSINLLTGGWQKPDLIIIAARPAMGKTAFMLNLVRACAKSGKNCAVFSLEMSKDQLTDRLIAIETHEASASNISKGKITEDQYQAIVKKSSQMLNWGISIDDTAGLSINQLKSKAYKLKNTNSIDMIVVDYLQLMSGEGKGNREQEISQISRGLKKLAKELDIPVIALSQLSRSVETRGGDKRPQLSDLRESGAIEQDADIVIFLYRPEYYGIMEIEGESMIGMGEIIFAKHRNGGLDSIMLQFIAQYTDFREKDSLDLNKPEKQESVNDFNYSNNFRKMDAMF